MDNIIVTNQVDLWKKIQPNMTVISAMEYITKEQYISARNARIFNHCRSYHYQSVGYYISLIAEARGHKALPSIITIRDSSEDVVKETLQNLYNDEIQSSLSHIKSPQFELSVYFGKNVAHKYDNLARKIYDHFPMPIFKVEFAFKKEWLIKKIHTMRIEQVPQHHLPFLQSRADYYFSKKRYAALKEKKTKFDLAILYNEQEKTKPSDELAIKKFIEAAEKLDINAEILTKNDSKHLLEYDALFIRETTSVNHYTYKIARKAMAEGIVVIDDPISILRCSNKVFLAELMNKNNILVPKTIILNKYHHQSGHENLTFPCVLKQPDSAFSQGVIKVSSQDELVHQLKHYFSESDLVIAQEYLFSPFDWRIGIMNNAVLFACRYYMAKDHWQIYNWASKEDCEGEFDNVPLSEVPKKVVETALKATKAIGDGLYGVDLKQVGDAVYVIEVNDNPNIDSGIEDKLIGDKLYQLIMENFLQKIYRQHGYEKK